MEVVNPVIMEIADNRNNLIQFRKELNIDGNEKEQELICTYPTVYIHNWKNNEKFDVYVGESNDFFQRTQQHYDLINEKDSWQHNLKNNDGVLYVIAHRNFNKSLTLDVENRLIHYLSSCSSVSKVHNARGNPQNKYYPCEDLDSIFTKIWKQLRKNNKDLFLSESEIKDSAIFKASPLHKLNHEQIEAKEKILDKIYSCILKDDEEHQLIFVQGDAGTGKTVLMSSIFYELMNKSKNDIEDGNIDTRKIETAILVNHNEQLTVYDEITKKLDLKNDKETVVFKPTQFINLFIDKKNSPKKRDKIYDVVFVDEAHLLFTQKNQSFTGENGQLAEIMKYAKTVVVMFDRKQVMNTKQYLDDDTISQYVSYAKKHETFVELKMQMRIQANKNIQKWIKDFCIEGKIEKLSEDCGKYEIRNFNSPSDLEKSIRNKASYQETTLSRMIATYDWDYSSKSEPIDDNYWSVKIGNWSRPWNYELGKNLSKKYKKSIMNLSWAEQPHTIDEIGSTYTIQGFDLNYVGVILGPSIKYRNNKIVFDPSESKNKDATNNRTLKDGSKQNFAEEFLKNELGVLMSRGVNGLYIYACDDELRKQLNKCI